MRGWDRGWGGEAGCEDEGTEEEEVMAVTREREQGGEGSGSVSGVDSFEKCECGVNWTNFWKSSMRC